VLPSRLTTPVRIRGWADNDDDDDDDDDEGDQDDDEAGAEVATAGLSFWGQSRLRWPVSPQMWHVCRSSRRAS
jgi:hypothetical protein